MKNPWVDLPLNAPIVLPCDVPYVNAYNNQEDRPDFQINTSLIPEPFHGNPDASVVVLLLNPGINGNEEVLHKSKAFSVALRASIQDHSISHHFHLNDEQKGPGFVFWKKACKALSDIPDLSQRIFSVEFSPYHSKLFGHEHLRLPSQEYSFTLVRRAIAREAMIICMRGEKQWIGAVPELASYKQFLKLVNPRSATLSEKNFLGFSQLKSILQGNPKC